MIDLINHPPHYTDHPSGVECIEIAEHFNFCTGNAIKYIWRAGLKTDNPIEDLRKAQWYLAREIARLEAETHPARMHEMSMLDLIEKIRATAPETNTPTTAPKVSSLTGAVQPPDVRADIPSGGPSGGTDPDPAASSADLPAAAADGVAAPSATPFVIGPYSEAEIDLAAELLREGATKVQIADRLNRDVRGIHAVMARARARAGVRVTAKTPASPDASPQARPAPAPRPPETDGAATPSAPLSPPRGRSEAGKSGIRYELAIWLDTCGNPEPWTPAKDLALAEAIVRGDGIAGAAMEIEIPSDDCRARWQDLTRPIRGDKGLSIDGQAALLAELRERAG